jgi:mannose-6-phosphate isomerase-like protein (cupin superfamily)
MWATGDLSFYPDHVSPDGSCELRLLPSLAAGEITYVLTPESSVPGAAILTDATEFLFVLEGSGELWRLGPGGGEVVPLEPGRSVRIDPHVPYQFRSLDGPLALLVASAPRRQRPAYEETEVARWLPGGTVTMEIHADPASSRLAPPRDVADADADIAPDGSEIRPLQQAPLGGIAWCRVPSGGRTLSGRHRTVDEIWYVLGGDGAFWRREASGQSEIVPLRRGRCLTIPRGVAFQARAGERDLEVLIGTFPAWPGPAEWFADQVGAPWP